MAPEQGQPPKERDELDRDTSVPAGSAPGAEVSDGIEDGDLEGSRNVKSSITIQGVDPTRFFGVEDRHTRVLDEAFPEVHLVARDREIRVDGPGAEVNRLIGVIGRMMNRLKNGDGLGEADLRILLEESKRELEAPENYQDHTVVITNNKRRIYPRTVGQHQYIQAVEQNDITFSIGPAGTGKTYLAVALAVRALQDREVQRIVLARPAVEAGESLGFLPGDLKEKVDPYLRPLYDALYDMIPSDRLRRYLETHTIEVVPLAFMRGRTLNNAFVILDEAQNTTAAQMKMFLTRLGVNSKAIVTGDVTQVDLPSEKNSGLIQIQSILMAVEDIAFVYLTERDVVRHRLVRDIIRAYKDAGL